MRGFGIYNYEINQKIVHITSGRFIIGDDNELIDKEDSKNHLKNFFYTRFHKILNGEYYLPSKYDKDEMAAAFGILSGLKMETLVKRFGKEKVANAIGKPLNPIITVLNKVLNKQKIGRINY